MPRRHAARKLGRRQVAFCPPALGFCSPSLGFCSPALGGLHRGSCPRQAAAEGRRPTNDRRWAIGAEQLVL